MADLALLASHTAFSMTTLSAAIQKAPYVPQLLGQMSIFTPERSRTTTIAIEEKGGMLTLIPVSERGAPLQEGEGEKRNIKYFATNRIARGRTLYAHELQNIRAFGETSELQGVQNQIAEMMNGTTGLRAAVELTHEHMRLGAVQGKVMDAGGKVLYDWFEEFGIARPATIDFDFASANDTEGKVRVKCNEVIRAMMRGSHGAWLPGMTRAVALCGDSFYDDLTSNAETRSTYLSQQGASELRNDVGQAFGSFRYGNIEFINYRGTDDKSTVAINDDECQFFPVGAPDAFKAGFSPAEFLPFVNTPGQDVYAMVVVDKERQAWARPEVYSYPLFMCTRPGMLQRGKRKA